MKNNLLTAFLAALLCLCLIACGTARNIRDTVRDEDPSGPVLSLEDTEQIAAQLEEPGPASSWDITDDITASLLQSVYPEGTEQITMILENRGAQTLTYGEEVSFEKYFNGAWEPVETISKYFFHSAAYELQPCTTDVFTISPWFLEKPLDAGQYRINGGEMRTEDNAVHPAWQLEFIVAEDAPAEPDFAVFVSSQPLREPESIPVYIVNTTGEANSILLIPHLERQTDAGEWVAVDFADGVGFCGVSDPLPVEGMALSEPVETLWGELKPGIYRISYDITGSESVAQTASGEFLLERPRGTH